MRVLIAGASRGIGAALARHFVDRGDSVLALSRSPASAGDWLRCDLADPADLGRAAGTVEGPLDALVYVAGIWEETAFSPGYDFASRPADEAAAILRVNLTAAIELAQALVPQLRSGRGRIVLIGSTSGLPNNGTPEVAYNASKAGLAGAAQALQAGLKGIAVSLINPHDVATDEVLAGIAEGSFRDEGPVALADIAAAVDFALTLSPGIAATEITLRPAAR